MSKATWTCRECEEVHEDAFDACWKCGEPRASESPYRSAPEVIEEVEEVEEESGESVEERIVARFKCAKCDGKKAATRRIATTGTGLSKIFDIQHNHFVALTCQHCGFTELFDPGVLEGKARLSTILDVVFGS